jgi:hypothetical protein
MATLMPNVVHAVIGDFKFPDRIVLGTVDECGRKVMSDNYGPLSLNQAPLMSTERRTAEMIKYAANAFVATITFINELRRRLRKVRANVQEVARGIGLENRVGAKFACRSRVRRSCSPKDTKALIKIAKNHDVSLHCPRGQREPQARDGAKSEPGPRRLTGAARPPPCSAHLQAGYRRHATASSMRASDGRPKLNLSSAGQCGVERRFPNEERTE